MSKAAAKKGDKVVGTDSHIVNVPNPPPATGTHPETISFSFNGSIDGNCSRNVRINGNNAAMIGSTATNSPSHFTPPPTAFAAPPTNQGSITTGSNKVRINRNNAAFDGSKATTCNDVGDKDNSKVEVANAQTTANVFIGGCED